MTTGEPPHEVGVIHGRFQVLHNDHLRYLLAGRALCHHLVVGITNPDPLLTRDDPADPARHRPEANPLTYWERYQLVRAALLWAGVPEGTFSVVPFPVNLPELYRHYLPLDAVFYLTIYDDWGRRKLAVFQDLGLRTHVLWERPPEQKGLSGARVRAAMARGQPWKPHVPPPVAERLEAWGVPERIRRLNASGTPA